MRSAGPERSCCSSRHASGYHPHCECTAAVSLLHTASSVMDYCWSRQEGPDCQHPNLCCLPPKPNSSPWPEAQRMQSLNDLASARGFDLGLQRRRPGIFRQSTVWLQAVRRPVHECRSTTQPTGAPHPSRSCNQCPHRQLQKFQPPSPRTQICCRRYLP